MRSLKSYQYIEDGNRRDESEGCVEHRDKNDNLLHSTQRLGHYFISCWCIADEQLDVGMLKSKFLGKNPGLIIFSTVGQVETALKSSFDQEIKHARVCYYNSNKQYELDEPVICKRDIFIDERKYRFWVELEFKNLESLRFRVDPSFIEKYELYLGKLKGISSYFCVNRIPANR